MRLLVEAREREAGDHQADQGEEDEFDPQRCPHQPACPLGPGTALVAIGGVVYERGVAAIAIGLDHLESKYAQAGARTDFTISLQLHGNLVTRTAPNDRGVNRKLK